MKREENILDIYDTDDYYKFSDEGFHDSCLYIGYNIRNFSNRKIKILTKGGLTIKSTPLEFIDGFKVIKDDVQLDVHFSFNYIDNVMTKKDFKCGSKIDEIIIGNITNKINEIKKQPACFREPINKFTFTLPLSKMGFSFNDCRCYSEILGIMVCSEHSDRDSFVDDLPETYLPVLKKPQSPSFQLTTGTFKIIQLVDSNNVIGQLWTMMGNEIVKINKVRNTAIANGLYIYTNKSHEKNNHYDFYPIEALQDPDLLAKLGISDSQSELLEGIKTKEFIELKKENSRLRKMVQEHEGVVSELERIKRVLQDMKDIEYRRKEMERIEKRNAINTGFFSFIGGLIKGLVDIFKLIKVF